jgi:hypothetical protein
MTEEGGGVAPTGGDVVVVVGAAVVVVIGAGVVVVVVVGMHSVGHTIGAHVVNSGGKVVLSI